MQTEDRKKAEFYRLAKVWGLISFIPVVLAAGPLAGYFLGDYLEKKIGFAPYLSLLCMAFGFASSIREIVKILKLIHKTDVKPGRSERPQ